MGAGRDSSHEQVRRQIAVEWVGEVAPPPTPCARGTARPRGARAAFVAGIVIAALALPAVASAHAYLTKTFPSPSVILDSAPRRRRAHLRRGRRAALRDHLGHRQGRPPGDDRPGSQVAGEPRHADRSAPPAPGGGLVPRLLACDLGRRPPGAGRLHLRSRPERRARAAVQDPAYRPDGDDDAAPRRALGGVPDDHERDRAARPPSRDRAPGDTPRPRHEPPGDLEGLPDRLGARASSRCPSISRSRPPSTRSAPSSPSTRSFRSGEPRPSAAATSTWSSASPSCASPESLPCGSTGPTGSIARSRRSSPGSGSRRARRRCWSFPARQAMRHRRRLVASLLPSTGFTSSPDRSGSVGSWACSSSGGASRPPRRVAGLAVVVPRFSNVAFVSVGLLLGSGIWAAVLHLPILSALWITSYGLAILTKAGLLALAMLLGAINLLRHETAAGCRSQPARSSARPRRPCCAGSSRAR